MVDFTSGLVEAIHKKPYVSPSQTLPIQKAATRKIIQKGPRTRASPRVLTLFRDKIVANKANLPTKIKKTKKIRKSLFRKVSSDIESEVELVLESDTCTEDSDDKIIKVIV